MIARTPQEKRKLAAYLQEHDPVFLDGLKQISAVFGPMEAVYYKEAPVMPPVEKKAEELCCWECDHYRDGGFHGEHGVVRLPTCDKKRIPSDIATCGEYHERSYT